MAKFNESKIKALRSTVDALEKLDGMNKVLPQDLVGEQLVLHEALKVPESEYHAIIFKSHPDTFIFSTSALEKIIEQCGGDIENLVVMIKPQKRTSNGNNFNPVRIIGFFDEIKKEVIEV